MKNKKKNVIILLVSLISIFIILILLCMIYQLYMAYYKPLEFQYEGSALGNEDIDVDTINDEKTNNGWTWHLLVEKGEWNNYLEVCEWHDFDFQPELKEDEEYICTYACRLKSLEYSPWRRTPISGRYDSLITLWTDDYQENVYYFYKVKKPCGEALGNMDEWRRYESDKDRERYIKNQIRYFEREQRKYLRSPQSIACVVIIGSGLILILYQINALYIPYKQLSFEYKGKASGKLNIIMNEPEEWVQEKYVYNTYEGYFTVRKRGWDFCVKECEWHDFDFQPELAEDEEYVCTYGYRLKTLEYSRRKRTKKSKGYYNRATLSTDDFQENVYYFYKIKAADSIHLGGMNEDDERTEYDYYR